jgi:hypothetical protein
MSLQQIAVHKKRKRNYYDGGGGGDYAGPDDNGGYQGGGAEGNAFGGGLGGGSSLGSNNSDLGFAGVGDSGAVAGEYGGGEYGVQSGEFGNPAAASSVAVPNKIGTALARIAPALSAINPAFGALASLGGKALTSFGGSDSIDLASGLGGGQNSSMGQNEGAYDAYAGRANDGHEPPDYESTATADKPFGGDAPAQTTTLPGGTGPRRYVWDPKLRQYVLANLGGQDNPMGYSQGQTFAMAAGGPVPPASGLGAAGQARFMRGGGTGLSDSIPVQMDDGGQGRLGDGEFVIPADIVSGLGGGSSEAGARALYEMIDRVRQQAHGSTEQIKPVDRSAMAA